MTALGDGESWIVSRLISIDAFKGSLVANLRRARGSHPCDRGLKALVAELLAASDRFREL